MAGADNLGRLAIADTALLLIDVQEKFAPAIHGMDKVIDNCVRLVRGCRELGVPILVTEQYPQGLGRTVPQVAEALGDFKPLVKTAFSLFGDQDIAGAILNMNRPNLLVAGVEAHVCVIKTALDALGAGYAVHWIADAVSSRAADNAKAATKRARQCGAFLASTEMVLFQMIDTAEHEKFRAISKIVK
jgi:nicotinamidase-related amidase